MRRSLEEGDRGAGVHYPWMDAMKRQGVKRAEVRLKFNVPFHIPHIWSARPRKFTAIRTLYFDKYDRDCAQITSPDRIAAFRSSGLEKELETYATQQALKASWFAIDNPRHDASQGQSYVDLIDDEWLPRTPSFLFPLREDSRAPLDEAILSSDEAELDRILASKVASSTALHGVIIAAAAGSDSCIVKSLLQAGADPNHRNESGQTPLMFASRNGQVDIVKVLLAGGAAPDVKSRIGDTAISLARYARHSDVVDLLEQAIAKRQTSSATSPR